MSHVHYMNQSVPFWDFVESLEQQGARPRRGGQANGGEHASGAARGRGGFRRGGFRGGRGRRQGAAKNQFATVDHAEESSSDEAPIMTPATPINEKTFENEKIETTETETENEKPKRGKMGRGRGLGRGRAVGQGRGMGRKPMNSNGPAGRRTNALPQRPMTARQHHFLAQQHPRLLRGGFGGPRGRRGLLQQLQRPNRTFNMNAVQRALDSDTSDSERKGRKGRMNKKAGGKKNGAKKTGPKKQGMNQNGKMNGAKKANKNGGGKFDFHPLADVFNTPEAHVMHVSLPGANREDVKVAWRPKKGFLVVKGTVSRPGDEEFLQTLSKSGREVGTFKRRVRLGRPGKPAKIDAERISATLEAGILKVIAPKKLDEYVAVEKAGLV